MQALKITSENGGPNTHDYFILCVYTVILTDTVRYRPNMVETYEDDIQWLLYGVAWKVSAIYLHFKETAKLWELQPFS